MSDNLSHGRTGRRRISRTTPGGVGNSSCFEKGPSPETLEALDAVAEAATQHVEQAEQEARAYALSTSPGEHIRPRDLQAASKGAVSFNAACRILEALERDGELVRPSIRRAELVWQRAQLATPPSRGYALPLSQREYGALLRLLDAAFRLSEPWTKSLPGMQAKSDADLLRAVRLRLKRPA